MEGQEAFFLEIGLEKSHSVVGSLDSRNSFLFEMENILSITKEDIYSAMRPLLGTSFMERLLVKEYGAQRRLIISNG